MLSKVIYYSWRKYFIYSNIFLLSPLAIQLILFFYPNEFLLQFNQNIWEMMSKIISFIVLMLCALSVIIEIKEKIVLSHANGYEQLSHLPKRLLHQTIQKGFTAKKIKLKMINETTYYGRDKNGNNVVLMLNYLNKKNVSHVDIPIEFHKKFAIYIISIGHFTQSVRELSKGKNIHLIDGSTLVKIIKHNSKYNKTPPF